MKQALLIALFFTGIIIVLLFSLLGKESVSLAKMG